MCVCVHLWRGPHVFLYAWRAEQTYPLNKYITVPQKNNKITNKTLYMYILHLAVVNTAL